ncbi:MAG TPA: branched-chain amino acid ABC transporter permease [bacterium]|nr:branched-chain amino acid ABC transporter permease [bacterium]
MVHEALQLIVFGLISGAILALSGIGLSLTYGILKFANFAHGDMMTLGAFMALMVLSGLRAMGWHGAPLGPLSFGWPMLVSTVAAMVLTAVVAVVLDRILYRPLRTMGSAILLISSVGVAFGLRAVIQFIWSPQPQYYIRKIQISREMLGVRVKPDQIFILVLSAALVLALHLFLTRTRMGKAMRATADNMELARVTGIDTERVILWTWVIGAMLAAAAGVMIGIENKFITPLIGWEILIYIFAAVILGGIGSPYGAMAGGVIIGVSGELSTMVIPTEYKPVVAFVIMILMLLVKPTGLFGER